MNFFSVIYYPNRDQNREAAEVVEVVVMRFQILVELIVYPQPTVKHMNYPFLTVNHLLFPVAVDYYPVVSVVFYNF